jgi:hypothetical protein
MIGALVFAAATATLDLSDRSDARIRAGSGQSAALDLANTPVANLRVQDRQWTGDLVYAPSILVQNVLPPPPPAAQPVFINSVTLTSTWLLRHARISVGEDGTFGWESTAYLGLQGNQAIAGSATTGTGMTTGTGATMTGTGGQGLQLLPKTTDQTPIPFASSRSILLVGLEPGKRWRLALDVGYFVYGALDARGRALLPFQRGPLADASLAYDFNAIDHFIANLNAQRLQFDEGPCLALALDNAALPPNTPLPQCAPDEFIAVGTAGWSHALNRLSSASISVGASGIRSRLNPTDPYTEHVYPAGTLTYQYHVGIERRPTTLRIDAQLAPTIDNRTGLADNRAQLIGTGVWSGARVTLSEIFGVARSLGDSLEPPATFVFNSSSVLYRLTKHAQVGAALDYIWQTQENAGAYQSLIASLSFTIQAPVARF